MTRQEDAWKEAKIQLDKYIPVGLAGNFAVWDIEESWHLKHCVACKEVKCN
jgi:hypothetical protein